MHSSTHLTNIYEWLLHARHCLKWGHLEKCDSKTGEIWEEELYPRLRSLEQILINTYNSFNWKKSSVAMSKTFLQHCLTNISRKKQVYHIMTAFGKCRWVKKKKSNFKHLWFQSSCSTALANSVMEAKDPSAASENSHPPGACQGRAPPPQAASTATHDACVLSVLYLLSEKAWFGALEGVAVDGEKSLLLKVKDSASAISCVLWIAKLGASRTPPARERSATTNCTCLLTGVPDVSFHKAVSLRQCSMMTFSTLGS